MSKFTLKKKAQEKLANAIVMNNQVGFGVSNKIHSKNGPYEIRQPKKYTIKGIFVVPTFHVLSYTLRSNRQVAQASSSAMQKLNDIYATD